MFPINRSFRRLTNAIPKCTQFYQNWNSKQLCSALTAGGIATCVAGVGFGFGTCSTCTDPQNDSIYGWITSDENQHAKSASTMNDTKSILVIGGSGLGGCITAQILKALETELQKLDSTLTLSKVFDLIVGTAAGGIIAVGLAQNDMNCQQVDDFHDQVAVNVFNTKSSLYQIYKGLAKVYTYAVSKGLPVAYNNKVLDNMYKSLDGGNEIFVNKNNPNNCNCSIIGTLTNDQSKAPVLIQNYQIVDGNMNDSDSDGGSNEEILLRRIDGKTMKTWQTASATSTASSHREPCLVSTPKIVHKQCIFENLCKITHIGYNDKLQRFERLTDSGDKDELNKMVDSIYDLQMQFEQNDNMNDVNRYDITQSIDAIISQIKSKFSSKYQINSKLDETVFVDSVFSKDNYNNFNISVENGLANNNAPLLLGYLESQHIWPESNVFILSITPGVVPLNAQLNRENSDGDRGDHNIEISRKMTIDGCLSTIVADVNDGSCQLINLEPMVGYLGSINMSIMNPNIDVDKSGDMLDPSLMSYWREEGTNYTRDNKINQDIIQFWAKLLKFKYDHSR